MSEVNEERWRRHMTDEASAIAAQQVTAGAGHSPVDTPLAYGEAELESLARHTVQETRRECAAMLQAVLVECESRGEPSVPLDTLRELVKRMRSEPEGGSALDGS